MKMPYVYNLCITSQVYRNKTGKNIENLSKCQILRKNKLLPAVDLLDLSVFQLVQYGRISDNDS